MSEGLFAAKRSSQQSVLNCPSKGFSSIELARTLSGGIYDLCFLLGDVVLKELEPVNLCCCHPLMLALMHVFGKLFQRAYEMKFFFYLADKLVQGLGQVENQTACMLGR